MVVNIPQNLQTYWVIVYILSPRNLKRRKDLYVTESCFGAYFVWLLKKKCLQWKATLQRGVQTSLRYVSNLHYVIYVTCPKLNVPLASVYTLENKHQSPESEPCARVTWPSISNLLPIWTLFTVLLCSHNNYCQRWRSPPKKCKYGSKKLTCMVIFLMRTGWNFNSPTLDGVTTTYICIVLIFKAYFILIFFYLTISLHLQS